jgi:hypothetical protein
VTDQVDGEKRSLPDDVQQLLTEWKRQILKERVAAKQRRLLTSSVHPSSLDEITVVTRIGRIRLLRKFGRTK